MWGCRKAVKSLPGGDSWRYAGWRDLQASAGSKGLAPCQCLGAHLEYIYNHISFVGVHLHNTVKSFLQTVSLKSNVCGANQIFTQKLWLKHSVKVLHCQITLTTHKYDYVGLKQGSDSRFRAIRAYNHKVSALRQVPDSLCRWYASTYQSPRTGRWVPVTAGPDPLWCCLPSLPGSRVPPGCHWQHKTCGWGQLHSGPRLMPLLCWAPTEQTEHCYSPVRPAS